MRHRVFVPVVLLTSGLAACDGLRESDYEGEVVASMEGTVTTSGNFELPDDLNIPVIWDVMAQIPGRRFAEFPEVTGDFPAHFRLDFHQPPDEDQLLEFPDGNAVMLGRLSLTSLGPDDFVLEDDGSAVWGLWACNDEQIFAFLRDDVVPGSAAASYFGCGLDTEGSVPCGELTAGYHVMNVELGNTSTTGCTGNAPPGDPAYCEPDDMRLAPDDLDTEIVFDVTGASGCSRPWYRDPRTGW